MCSLGCVKVPKSNAKKKKGMDCLQSLSMHHSTAHVSVPALLACLALDLPFPLLSSPELPSQIPPNTSSADLLLPSSAGLQDPTPRCQNFQAVLQDPLPLPPFPCTVLPTQMSTAESKPLTLRWKSLPAAAKPSVV